MLDPEQVDLSDLALALEDHSEEHTWWLDPAAGELTVRFAAGVDDESYRGDSGPMIRVEPLPSAVSYGDMEEFVACVRDPRARDLLERSIAGRGAFRRFKDALLEHPSLRDTWFAFHDARSECRAVEWLLDHGLVEPEAAARAIASRPGPDLQEVPGVLDAHGVAHQVARDLRRVYTASGCAGSSCSALERAGTPTPSRSSSSS